MKIKRSSIIIHITKMPTNTTDCNVLKNYLGPVGVGTIVDGTLTVNGSQSYIGNQSITGNLAVSGTLSSGTQTIVGNEGVSGTINSTGQYTLGTSQYSTGTASQSGLTITGVGTTFTAAMVGGLIVFTNSGSFALITGFTSTTSLTANVNQNPSSSAFVIYYGGFQTVGTSTAVGTLISAIGIKGKTDASSAVAGNVGEYLSANSAGISASNNAFVTIATLSLTAGDWDVTGSVTLSLTAATIDSTFYAISINNATVDSFSQGGTNNGLINPLSDQTINIVTGVNRRRINLSSTTNILLVGYATTLAAGSGTFTGDSIIMARRVR